MRVRRFIFTLLLFVLAGAIINVAVAWGFGVSIKYSGCGELYERRDLLSGHVSPQVLLIYDTVGATTINSDLMPGYWMKQKQRIKTVVLDESQFTWSEIVKDENSLEHWGPIEEACGWPMRSMRWIKRKIDGPICGAIALEGPDRAMSYEIARGTQDQHLRGLTERMLPYIVIWPGFAINTIFYAAVLGLLFAVPGAVRRRVRRKRGQCAACGYLLRDITSEKCPECGASK